MNRLAGALVDGCVVAIEHEADYLAAPGGLEEFVKRTKRHVRSPKAATLSRGALHVTISSLLLTNLWAPLRNDAQLGVNELFFQL